MRPYAKVSFSKRSGESPLDRESLIYMGIQPLTRQVRNLARPRAHMVLADPATPLSTSSDLALVLGPNSATTTAQTNQHSAM